MKIDKTETKTTNLFSGNVLEIEEVGIGGRWFSLRIMNDNDTLNVSIVDYHGVATTLAMSKHKTSLAIAQETVWEEDIL